jgi:hypothetical protein
MAGSVLADYNTANISISPLALNATVLAINGGPPTQLGGLLGDLCDNLETIATTLSNLELSWVGDSASEAQDFNDRYQEACDELFGTQADPSLGVLPRLVAGLYGALSNYSASEDYVVKMFTSFQAASSGSGGAPTPQTVVNPDPDHVITAITETA